uniref:Uncharacterized protein n=1 Tax=Meloidogyne enterolobii TaxID=390850 RepID=A0A6V7VJH4_MELEN|nr:unnamed protein product [Meloidogyne enterolobii]
MVTGGGVVVDMRRVVVILLYLCGTCSILDLSLLFSIMEFKNRYTATSHK